MKKRITIFLLILIMLLTGCNSPSNKILGFIELHKTPEKEIINKFNLEIECEESWDNSRSMFVLVYIWHFADYALNNVKGTVRVYFEDLYV